jgi:hypothetical protein
MRIALCLSGLAGGLSDKTASGRTFIENPKGQRVPVDWQRGFEHYEKYLLNVNNNVDIFIHTWNEELEEELTAAYRPKLAIFELQRTFAQNIRRQNAYSRWYGVKQVSQLKKAYEEQNGFAYDFVMLGRFDIAWQTSVIFNKFDPAFFYVGNWIQAFKDGNVINPHDYYYRKLNLDPSVALKKHGWPHEKNPHTAKAICDHWFFSNSEFINQFSELFDYMKDYYAKRPGTTNHIMSMQRLIDMKIEDRIKFAFDRYDDFPLVRHIYHDWRE